MFTRRNSSILSVLVFAAGISSPGFAQGATSSSGPSAEARWFKGNLHTHSLWSDGDDYPEMIADWYKRRRISLPGHLGSQRAAARGALVRVEGAGFVCAAT